MNKEQIRTNYLRAEIARTRHERALRLRVQRKLILGTYGLTDPKELLDECKHCNNFYCTFCFKCRYYTHKDTDPDYQAKTKDVTKNFTDYAHFCNAVVREYISDQLPRSNGIHWSTVDELEE